MKKAILLLLSACLCLSSCGEKFLFDNMYEDEAVFDLKVTIGNPKDITSSSAVIPVTIKTKETILSRGVVIAAEQHSSSMYPFPSESTDNKFEVTLSGITSGATVYVRGYCITTSGTYYSLEKSFTTKK